MEETRVRDTNIKTQLSLAAALFFSPFVQYSLKTNTWDITDNDRDFIRSYIKFWYITLVVWFITIVSGIAHYLFVIYILEILYTISIFILLFLIVISIVSIISDISIIKSGNIDISAHTIEGNKKDIIFKYIPIYNIYLWYQAHSFDKPNRWIKESLLLWTLFLWVSITWNVWLSTIVLIIIIIRTASLMSDIDLLPTQTKQYINKIFLKNPEEIWWYVTWFLRYICKMIIRIFRPIENHTLESEVYSEKESYSHIIDIKENKNIIIEYILWIILLFWFIYFIQPDFTVRTYYTGFLLFILRYLTMAIQLKHLPHFPIAREIMLFAKGIEWLFKHKSFTPNP